MTYVVTCNVSCWQLAAEFPASCMEVATAMKWVIAWQIQEMKAQKLSKTTMASRMHTSRAALNRLLDATDTSLTLTMLASAAALGKRVW